jgi:Uma2 family endonuclease
MNTHTLNLESVIELSDEQFYQLCRRNPDLRFERSATGELIIMSPTAGGTGKRNFRLNGKFAAWVEQNDQGYGFDSSTGFTLPNNAIRSPDLSWIRKERWDALEPEQEDKFSAICPDFVVELKSKSDRLSVLQAKMVEYIENGAQLGWLINPDAKQVEIYRPNQESGYEKELLEMPQTLFGEDVLPGLELDIAFMWA